MKTKEELAEEIRREHWCKHCQSWWEFTEGEREESDPLGNCELDAEKDCNERTSLAMTRIGEAYARGELELPGEVGRSALLSIDQYHRYVDKGCIFIALTGTEEEG